MSQDVNFDISYDTKKIKVRTFKSQILLYSYVMITLAGYVFRMGLRELGHMGMELCHTLMEARHMLMELCHILVEAGHMAMEVSHMMIEVGHMG